MSQDPHNKNEQQDKALLSKESIAMLVIGVIGILAILAYINYSVSQNLQEVIDNRPSAGMDVRKQVGKDIYDDIVEDVSKLDEESEQLAEQQEELEIKLEQERKRVQELTEQEPLKDGHVWRYDVLTGEMVQTPVDELSNNRYEDPDLNGEDYLSELESNIKDEWDNQPLKIDHPRDEVILELAKPIDQIDPDKIFLTKGQFIFWLQDNLLYLVGDNAIQTFWDPETYEARIVTHYGDSENVEKLTRERIEIAYKGSSYGVYDADKLTIIYE